MTANSGWSRGARMTRLPDPDGSRGDPIADGRGSAPTPRSPFPPRSGPTPRSHCEPRPSAPQPFGPRLAWADLPAAVRGLVEQALGSPVVTAADQRGGFSPGVAARVTTETGGRAFLKACSTAVNPGSVQLFAQEARVLDMLPHQVDAPGLVGHLEQPVGDTQWGILLTEDIEGRQPRTPWKPAELAAALTAYQHLASISLPAGLNLPTLADALAWETTLMAKVDADPPAALDPWVGAHAHDLTALAARARAALAGGALVHLDARSDNLLITPSGSVRIVDWPWACIGAPWMDVLNLALNAKVYDHDADVQPLLEAIRESGANDDAVDSVLAALTGYFWYVATQPPPPGLPTLRSFQLAQAQALSRWLATRLER